MLFSNPNYLYIVSTQKKTQPTKKTPPKKKKPKITTHSFLPSTVCFSNTVSIVQEKGWDSKQFVI